MDLFLTTIFRLFPQNDRSIVKCKSPPPLVCVFHTSNSYKHDKHQQRQTNKVRILTLFFTLRTKDRTYNLRVTKTLLIQSRVLYITLFLSRY